jgi:hypothetical protein
VSYFEEISPEAASKQDTRKDGSDLNAALAAGNK